MRQDHRSSFRKNILFLLVTSIFLLTGGPVFAQLSNTADDSNTIKSEKLGSVTESEATDEQSAAPERTPEEERRYWAARENSPWEKMFILYNLQLGMPALGFFSQYEAGNTILVTYETIIGASFVLDGIGMYSKSFVKNRPLSATLKLLGGLGFLALAYYQHTEVGKSSPDSRFWKGYLAYQLLAIPLELYALTVEY